MRRLVLMHGALLWSVWLVIGVSGEVPIPPSAIYSGGSHDGWAMDESREPGVLPGPRVRVSWGGDHFFDMRAVSLTVPDLTIQESDDAGALGIRRGHTMRLAFPERLNLRWCIDELVYGGSAAAKTGVATLTENDSVIEIPVVADFAVNEALLLRNLVITGCRTARQMQGRLRLDYDSDGIWDAYDTSLLTAGMIWAGGAYDGWAADQAQTSATLRPQATLILLR